MPTVQISDGVALYDRDWGPRSRQPIVLSHRLQLSANAWDRQMLSFGSEGYRVIAHDRLEHDAREDPARVCRKG